MLKITQIYTPYILNNQENKTNDLMTFDDCQKVVKSKNKHIHKRKFKYKVGLSLGTLSTVNNDDLSLFMLAMLISSRLYKSVSKGLISPLSTPKDLIASLLINAGAVPVLTKKKLTHQVQFFFIGKNKKHSLGCGIRDISLCTGDYVIPINKDISKKLSVIDTRVVNAITDIILSNYFNVQTSIDNKNKALASLSKRFSSTARGNAFSAKTLLNKAKSSSRGDKFKLLFNWNDHANDDYEFLKTVLWWTNFDVNKACSMFENSRRMASSLNYLDNQYIREIKMILLANKKSGYNPQFENDSSVGNLADLKGVFWYASDKI